MTAPSEAALFGAAQVDHVARLVARGERSPHQIEACAHHYARRLGVSVEEIHAARRERAEQPS